MARKTLDLSTGNESDLVVIDGVEYPLLDAGDLTMVQLAKLRRQSARFAEISAKRDLNEDEAREADDLIEETFRTIVPGVPEDVAARLSQKKKGLVTQFFFQALVEAATRDRTGMSPASPASSVSTAET